MISWYEAMTSVNRSTAWGKIIKIVERFTELERFGNIYVGVFRVAFVEPILHTADLTQ
jgi:hypothetical protein